MSFPLVFRSSIAVLFAALTLLSMAAVLVLCVAGEAARAAPMPLACDGPRFRLMIGQTIMVGFPGDDEKDAGVIAVRDQLAKGCLLYTSPSPRDGLLSRM